ncbi:hypothetical protein FK178_08150 [Antarcticibacterium arcticum]|uniref:Alpha-2-macroglobulin domain-containing protein n=1 Tax=Antarcticibacterium arcticum TaxID=2585771 RepID=A0A5B8YIY6_9FLAO|nr:MG2 domain-containing protein [Antarcticibacterium arcticum]QED37695.1 hypothetical protein FK178_08150 [Antarcticibacterium arcticum]
MKILLPALLLFTNLLFAQTDLNVNWNTLDSLEVHGLIESANEKTLEIISIAKEEKSFPDLIKGKIFHYKFYQIKNESAASYILRDLNTSISSIPTPYKNVLLSYKADFLKQYFEDNRWKNRGRKEIDDPDLLDMETWSNHILLDSIASAFYKSLENEEVLIKTPVENFEDLLQQKKLNRIYRPTLYDLLVHQALDFFSNSSNTPVEGAGEQYILKNPTLYGPSTQFLKMEFSKDVPSTHQRVLRLYQKLETLHKETAPLVYAILNRLEYVNTYYTGAQKWQNYEDAILAMNGKYKGELPAALILLKIAEMYYDRSGETDENGKLLHPDFLQKAVALTEEIIRKYPNTDSSQMAARLKSSITSVSVGAKIPAILSHNEPGRIFLNYKGLDSLELKIIKVKHDFQNKITYRNRDSIIHSVASKETPVISKLYSLPQSADFNNHSTELAFPGLEKGNYLVFVSEKKPGKKNNFSFSFMQVTDLVLTQRGYDQFQIYKTLDRKSGKRIAQAKLQFFTDRTRVGKTLLTDNKGEVKENNTSSRQRSPQILVIKKGDTLNTNYWQSYYRRNYNNAVEEPTATTLLYLDRAIYRPGQKVYFKGVLLTQENKKTSTVPNEFVEVYVDDPNGEELHYFRLKTNKYGSFNGEFLLPTGGITGEFSIYTEEDTETETIFWNKIQEAGEFFENGVSFRVEEYKRPTFEVKFDSIDAIYKPGDTISITGQALSFSGAPISNSRLIYEVQRQKQNYSRWYQHYSDPVPVKLDTIDTGADGKFNIQFPALFNEEDLMEENLLYKFNITATVTDASGETREATTSLKLGKKNLLASLNIAEEINTGSKLQPVIEATNLNSVPVEVTGSLKIYKLQSPDRVLKARLWEAPEIQQIPEKEFIELFPEEPYASENDPKNWPKGELSYTYNFSGAGSFEPEIDLTGWYAGKYLAEVLVDNGNFTATAAKVLTLRDPQNLYSTANERFSLNILNSKYLEEGFVSIVLQTAYKDLRLEVAAFDGYKKVFDQFIEVNSRKELKIPVSGLSGREIEIQVTGVKNNSGITVTKRISLEREKTFLNIETGTFRNKIEPGAEETWSFKITNEKDAVPDAEILASMYDASLDQFATTAWNLNPGFSQEYLRFPSYNLSNVGNVQFLENRFNDTPSYSPGKRVFDRLQMFGFRFNSPNSYVYRQYLRQKTLSANNANELTGNTRGSVMDNEGMPLPGVMVIIQGSTKGTSTNFDGEFALDAQPGDILIFSSIGFTTWEHLVEKDKNIYVIMKEDSSSLDEVVVVGYGDVNEEEISISEEAMVSEDFEMALAGKVAGLSISPAAPGGAAHIRIRGASSIPDGKNPLYIVDGEIVTTADLYSADIADLKILDGAAATAIYGQAAANGAVIISTKTGMLALQNVEARKNLDETAIFFPNLSLDQEGKVNFSFTSPEALTQWKLRLLAHTNTWSTGTYEGYVRTQKELSITPNAPRFLREGDSITFKARISNLSGAPLNGTAMLQLYNAVTMQPVDLELKNRNNIQPFHLAASGNTAVSFDLVIPKDVPAVTYRIIAKAGNFSDGEENTLPVLSNRMLVRESLPLFVRAGETKTYEFKNLSENTSETLQNQAFSLEYTSNPAWIALQSLPYLMEFAYECSEQTFARLYANSLAAKIMNRKPQIKEVFESWEADSSLVSNLEKNKELKNLLLAETPWVRDAQSETVQKQQLANLFELKKLESEQKELMIKLERMQNSSGAFPWFSGGRDNYFITRHIIAGLGHLKKLDVPISDSKIVARAIVFLDAELIKAERENYDRKNQDYFYKSSAALHHLYARSFYMKEIPLSPEVQAIEKKILKAQKEDWLQKSIYNKALLSLVLSRYDEKNEANKIVQALKESAVNSEEYGMYWKENERGWFWHNAPIETQALIIEAFAEFPEEKTAIEEMKIWLLQNKRTNHWPTTKATTEATYALLMQGDDWLQSGNEVILSLGSKPIPIEKLEAIKTEAGTGYQKLKWTGEEMDESFSKITVENNNTTAGYGGAYWQYFEDLDKIKVHTASPLNVEKELYLNVNNQSGKSLNRIDTNTPVKIGDLVTVRLVVRTTADMEYIHLKDMRASGFEPTNVLSEYKYQDGTAYYESTKDAATHFFFDLLRKGTYVLEYTVRANNAGNFSNGITSIGSLYAPEFSGHTKGIRVNIEGQK